MFVTLTDLTGSHYSYNIVKKNTWYTSKDKEDNRDEMRETHSRRQFLGP